MVHLYSLNCAAIWFHHLWMNHRHFSVIPRPPFQLLRGLLLERKSLKSERKLKINYDH